ncbi:MAG: hypothetical protein J6Y58_10375 [Clostridiales bacterium]|nr:hypothetical protein [Clostridiales bacterium]
MIDIEKEILELTSEAKELPETMNMDRIRRRAKKRKRIHTFAVVGRSLAGVLVTMFLALFIAVNSSVSVARAFSDVPVIGTLSRNLVVRSDIKKALKHNKNLAAAFEEEGLTPVDMVDSGATGQMTVTVDSFYADELDLILCLKLDTKLDPDNSYFYMRDIQIIDLNTGDNVYQDTHCSMDYFDTIGKLQFTEFFWDRPCTDFEVRFNLWRPFDEVPYEDAVIDSFRFEFHDVEPSAAIHIPIDETFTAYGMNFHFTEIQAAGSMTKVFYDYPEGENITFHTFDLYITDENGNVISDEFQAFGSRMTGYDFFDENGKQHNCEILPSIFYDDCDSVSIHISTVFCTTHDPRFLKIDPENRTGTFEGKTFPIEVCDSSTTYSDYGLPSMPYYDTLEEKVFFVVPYDEEMPEFDGTIMPLTGGAPQCDGNVFPVATINGEKYLVIEYYKYNYDEDGCYYFVQQDDSETLRVNKSFKVNL